MSGTEEMSAEAALEFVKIGINNVGEEGTHKALCNMPVTQVAGMLVVAVRLLMHTEGDEQ